MKWFRLRVIRRSRHKAVPVMHDSGLHLVWKWWRALWQSIVLLSLLNEHSGVEWSGLLEKYIYWIGIGKYFLVIYRSTPEDENKPRDIKFLNNSAWIDKENMNSSFKGWRTQSSHSCVYARKGWWHNPKCSCDNEVAKRTLIVKRFKAITCLAFTNRY